MGPFFPGALPYGILVFFLLAAVLRWLWNLTVPEVFGLRPLSCWQAFRLLFIAGILVGRMHFL